MDVVLLLILVVAVFLFDLMCHGHHCDQGHLVSHVSYECLVAASVSLCRCGWYYFTLFVSLFLTPEPNIHYHHITSHHITSHRIAPTYTTHYTLPHHIASHRSNPRSRRYSLSAVVVHHGLRATGGHYSAFTKDLNSGLWSCFNDLKVTPHWTTNYTTHQHTTDNTTQYITPHTIHTPHIHHTTQHIHHTHHRSEGDTGLRRGNFGGHQERVHSLLQPKHVECKSVVGARFRSVERGGI
jgi:hypothetical protein